MPTRLSKNPALHKRTDDATAVVGRTVRSGRQGLPGSRAIVGALLVSVAAVGTFATASGATARDSTSVVVAAHDLPVGTRLTSNDLRVLDVEIDRRVADHTVRDPSSLIGRTLLGPIRSGELLQTGSVATKTSSGERPELSFQLPAARALGGDLRSGETVDVLVTNKSTGTGASVAVHDAQVVRVERSSSGLGNSADVTIVIAVADREEAGALAAAIDNGQVTLVRTTGIANPQGRDDG